MAMRQYTQDNGGFYPDPSPYGFGVACSWPDRIFPYVRSSQIFQCPEAPELAYKSGCAPNETIDDKIVTFHGAYDMADLRDPPGSFTIRLTETRMRNPTSTILALDGTGRPMKPGTPINSQSVLTAGIPLRHDNAANVLFGDGHVKRLNLDALAQPEQWNVLNRR